VLVQGEGDGAELDQAVRGLPRGLAVQGDEAQLLDRGVVVGTRGHPGVGGVVEGGEALAVGGAQAEDEGLTYRDGAAALTPVPASAGVALRPFLLLGRIRGEDRVRSGFSRLGARGLRIRVQH